MIDKLLKLAGINNEEERKNKLYRDLLQHEAKIGGELFGEVPDGGRREFFCLDQYTWIWYEEWTENKQRQSRTTRYEIRTDGIMKIQDGQQSQQLDDVETLRLLDAMRIYERRVGNELYQAVA